MKVWSSMLFWFPGPDRELGTKHGNARMVKERLDSIVENHKSDSVLYRVNNYRGIPRANGFLRMQNF